MGLARAARLWTVTVLWVALMRKCIAVSGPLPPEPGWDLSVANGRHLLRRGTPDPETPATFPENTGGVRIGVGVGSGTVIAGDAREFQEEGAAKNDEVVKQALREQRSKQGSARSNHQSDDRVEDTSQGTAVAVFIIVGVCGLAAVCVAWCWLSTVVLWVSWCVCKFHKSRTSSNSTGVKKEVEEEGEVVRATFCGTLASVVCATDVSDCALPGSQPCTPQPGVVGNSDSAPQTGGGGSSGGVSNSSASVVFRRFLTATASPAPERATGTASDNCSDPSWESEDIGLEFCSVRRGRGPVRSPAGDGEEEKRTDPEVTRGAAPARSRFWSGAIVRGGGVEGGGDASTLASAPPWGARMLSRFSRANRRTIEQPSAHENHDRLSNDRGSETRQAEIASFSPVVTADAPSVTDTVVVVVAGAGAGAGADGTVEAFSRRRRRPGSGIRDEPSLSSRYSDGDVVAEGEAQEAGGRYALAFGTVAPTSTSSVGLASPPNRGISNGGGGSSSSDTEPLELAGRDAGIPGNPLPEDHAAASVALSTNGPAIARNVEGEDGSIPPPGEEVKSPGLPRAKALWRAFSEVDHGRIEENHRRAAQRHLARFSMVPAFENPPLCYVPFEG